MLQQSYEVSTSTSSMLQRKKKMLSKDIETLVQDNKR